MSATDQLSIAMGLPLFPGMEVIDNEEACLADSRIDQLINFPQNYVGPPYRCVHEPRRSYCRRQPTFGGNAGFSAVTPQLSPGAGVGLYPNCQACLKECR